MMHLKYYNFRIGVIGAGQIVTDAHLPTLLAMPGTSIEWITDFNFERAKITGRAFGIRYFKAPQDLNGLPGSDIVLLAIPFGVREPYYEILRERSSAVYVEKPFANNVEYHQKICSWFEDYRLGCGFQRRSEGRTQLLREVIRNKLFGRLRAVRFEHGNPGITIGGKYHGDIKLAGGGILFESGIHGIDTTCFATEATDVKVDSVKMIIENGFDIHTEANMVISGKDDEKIDFRVIVTCLQDSINGLEFYFENACLYLPFSGKDVTIRSLDSKRKYILTPYQGRSYPNTTYEIFHAHWHNFLIGLKRKESNYTAAAEGILTTKIIETVYKLGSVSS